jgi:hypothetical protein
VQPLLPYKTLKANWQYVRQHHKQKGWPETVSLIIVIYPAIKAAIKAVCLILYSKLK